MTKPLRKKKLSDPPTRSDVKETLAKIRSAIGLTAEDTLAWASYCARRGQRLGQGGALFEVTILYNAVSDSDHEDFLQMLRLELTREEVRWLKPIVRDRAVMHYLLREWLKRTIH